VRAQKEAFFPASDWIGVREHVQAGLLHSTLLALVLTERCAAVSLMWLCHNESWVRGQAVRALHALSSSVSHRDRLCSAVHASR
jgi:hypothetical protein